MPSPASTTSSTGAPSYLEDAKAAVRFLRAEASDYHIDPERFAAWGDFAGGYTAIILGVASGQTTDFDDPALGNPDVSSDVQAVVDWFGPTDDSGPYAKMGAKESPYLHRLSTVTAALLDRPRRRRLHRLAPAVPPSERGADQSWRYRGLSVLPGAFHEDPAFMRTERPRTVTFLTTRSTSADERNTKNRRWWASVAGGHVRGQSRTDRGFSLAPDLLPN